MRIKYGDRSFHNGNSLSEDGESEHALAPCDDGLELQRKILRVHDGREGVGKGLLALWRDDSAELRASQVANNLRWVWSAWDVNWRQEGAKSDQNVYLSILIVGDVKQSPSRATIDHLDPKDLGVWERDIDLDIQWLLRLLLVGPLPLSSTLHPLHHVLHIDILDGRGVGVFDLGQMLARKLARKPAWPCTVTPSVAGSWANAVKDERAAATIAANFRETIVEGGGTAVMKHEGEVEIQWNNLQLARRPPGSTDHQLQRPVHSRPTLSSLHRSQHESVVIDGPEVCIEHFITTGGLGHRRFVHGRYVRINLLTLHLDSQSTMGWVDKVPRAGNMYIGGLHALYQRQDLFKEYRISHIISALDFDLYEAGHFKEYTHIQVKLDDDPNENFFTHTNYFKDTNDFIESALNNGGAVFVHCEWNPGACGLSGFTIPQFTVPFDVSITS